MGTTRTFSTMLNEYLPNELLREEILQRDYFLKNVNKDNGWLGGDIIVPFEAASASSLKFGGLTDSTDISEYSYVRGKISGYKEVWGSLIFNHTDIMQHGEVSEKNFLKILPNQIDQFLQYMKEAVSINLLNGPHFASMTADTDLTNGKCTVDRIDRFSIGQKCYLDDNDSNSVAVYVIAIDVNNSYVTVSDSRGGSAYNISAYTTAQSAKFYHDGVLASHTPTNHFLSVKSGLLSAANGGSANLHGQTKLSYPYLQAINIDGSSITASNILEKIFDAYSTFRIKAKAAKANKVLMSYKHMGSVMKLLEIQKGQNNYKVGETRVNVYGWTEIDITTVKGGLTLVGIQEMNDSEIFFWDETSMTFRSNGFFRKRKSPDGKEYYEVRATTGYSYIVDVCLFGELEISKPTADAVIYGISY